MSPDPDTLSLAAHLRRMARNNAWSNHRLYEACGALSPSALSARRTGFFPSIRLTLNHILIVDWYYLDALEEAGRGLAVLKEDEPFTEFAALRAAQVAADARLMAFCDGRETADLARTVRLVRDGGRVFEERIVDVLAHLFVHQIHHRGQVHAMLSGTGVAPPQLDEFFLAQDAPLRADDLSALGWNTR